MAETQKNNKEVQIIAIGLLLVFLIGVYFFGQTWWRNKKADDAAYNNLATTANEAEYPTITAESLQKLLHSPDEKFIIVDIRDTADYTLSHIPRSLSYPGESITNTTLKNIQKIIVVGSDLNEETNITVAKFLQNQKIPYAFLKDGYASWGALNEQTVTTGDPNSFVDQSKLMYITAEELKKRFVDGENFYIIDVQPKENFAEKHLKGATNIPLSELEGRITEVPSGKKIVVYGQNDSESFQAGTLLFDLNIFSALTLSGANILTKESALFLEGSAL